MTKASRVIDIILHPRMPPLVRRHPPIETVSLLRSESLKKDNGIQDTIAVVAETAETAVVREERPQESVTTTSEDLFSLIRAPPAAIEPFPDSVPSIPASENTNVAAGFIAEAKDKDSIVSEKNLFIPNTSETNTIKGVGPSTSHIERRTALQAGSDDDEEMPEIDLASDTDLESM